MALRRFLRILGLLSVLSIFGFALYILQRELHDVHWRDIRTELRSFSSTRLFFAGLCVIVSYTCLTLYDYLAFYYLQRKQRYLRVAPASFITYVISHNVGFSFLGASAMRFRFYSAWSMTSEQIAKIIFFCSWSFWLGLLGLGGGILVFSGRSATPLLMVAPLGLRLLGTIFLGLLAAYLGACFFHGRVRFRNWEMEMPPPRIALSQLLISCLDWFAASGVLYTLISGIADVTYTDFMTTYMLAIILSLISNVPGGIGVFESVFLMHFGPTGNGSQIAGVLLLYRLMYYLMPFLVGVLALGTYELAAAKHKIARFQKVLAQAFPIVAPRLITYTTFAAGIVLLISGSLPTLGERQVLLEQYFPLTVIETSHLLGSIFGILLILVARGLQRRLDGAYLLAMVLLVSGAVVSLLKGFDYEEAIFLLFVAAILKPCRQFFYRHASLIHQRFSTRWLLAIGLTVVGMTWLVMFSYKHVEYSNDLWWTFSLEQDAPRSMRGGIMALLVVTVAGMMSLLRPAQRTQAMPSGQDLADAKRIVDLSGKTSGYLSLLGDKLLLFNPTRTSFIMYAVSGRSWVAMGDPVGPPAEKSDMIWMFRELVDFYDGWAVFYQVDAAQLNLYLDAGLELVKFGEEATVDLQQFSLQGRGQKALRNVFNRFEKEGYTFRIAPASEWPTLSSALRDISDKWLTHKAVREKRFSLGCFSDAYLQHFPIALVEHQQEVLAFANLWAPEVRDELSIDLMRYSDKAPKGMMDFLFIHLMLWGKEQGYHTFNLGMAPFSGIEKRQLSPTWNRMGAILYRYGEHFYNFKGIRDYKEKFEPTWQPKYLAWSSGLALPMVLANISSLISGGMTGVIRK